jgi:hypothetical protein
MKNRIAFGMGWMMTALVAMGASSASAQSSWGSETSDAEEARRRSQQQRSANDVEGPYLQAGITIGVIDFDGGNVDVDAGGGISLTGGYRIFPWLSGEANFTYVGGGDVEVGNTDVGDAEFFAFTFGPKVYPFSIPREKVVPDFVDPYVLIGLGGGEYEIDGSNGFRDKEDGTFIARFILGTDFWFTEHFGAYLEGGYHAAADNDIDGTGVFTFGGQYRF